ncbi:Inositol 2-dehydrogenase [Janthinobacterium sp. KBS0711]|uniref:Gfo/Idh/MocA family protein n=1 Tax=Janthinobacterium sp. KBS0711 TaxID=1649647 RepID=UPI0006279B2A|nr:Gfo/Idh/MocA family oxidoreductase [Janthinobacterium sp. KBS0711]KKO64808.1 Inositol 2-dehydrogenase [Janthinobacterium sp. KBS0711]TSD72499.1 Gfo/Idh/MocA family oxidoreductase [Janthinobacterium sp. KBS0711]
MQDINIGLIGAGYMGKAHTIAYKAVRSIFPTALNPVCECISTSSEAGAARSAQELGWNRSTGDWRALVNDRAIDAIVVATPPATHKDIVLAALALGKPVFCEKPLGMTAAESLLLAQAAEIAGVANMVGYNYIRTPASQLARQIIESGEIGEIIHVAAEHVEDYLHDPGAPASWRTREATATRAGALADVGSHLLNLALRLGGPVDSLVADMNTVHAQRQGPAGMEAVENDDQGNVMLRFASGALGALTFSRVAAGRKMGYTYRITGTKGAIAFDQENQNELWLYDAGRPAQRQGFQRLLMGPAHPDYLAFSQGAGHGTGYNEQIVIEARDFLQAIAGGQPVWPTFRDGYEVDRLIAAALRSVQERSWITVR